MLLCPHSGGQGRRVEKPHVLSLKNRNTLDNHLPNKLLHRPRRLASMSDIELGVDVIPMGLKIDVEGRAARDGLGRVHVGVPVRALDAAQVPDELIDYITAAWAGGSKREVEDGFLEQG